jgi:CBS domain-containing protein
MHAVALRIANFLKEFPPFNNLSDDNLLEIAYAIRVIRIEKNKTLFRIDDPLHDSFYVVASGVINLFVIADADEQLLNKCYPGDIFGLRPFFAKNNYMMTAKAREDSLIYAIPINVFKPFVAGNPEVLNFLLESFATNSRNPDDKKRSKLLSDQAAFNEQPSFQYFQSLTYNKQPLLFSPNATVKEVAQAITDNLTDNAVIIDQNKPIGLITDFNLRAKIATGRFEVYAPVHQVMTSPITAVDENVSLAEAQLLMLKNNITHLCVTQDGSENAALRGVISQRDLIVAQASNPGVLIKEIKKSNTADELQLVRQKLTELIASSLVKNVPLFHVQNIVGEINLAITRRAVELAILSLGSPPAPFAWLCLGSQGRKEQLLLSDQDSLLIFDDVAAEKYREVKDYFLNLAKNATKILENVGYPICKHSHVASNMLWCKSKSDWIKQFTTWIAKPSEKSNEIAAIFFDYELAYGDAKLEEQITDTIFAIRAEKNASFFDFLGNDALKKPHPLSFFKKFNLEENGANKDKFDIKTKGIMPLVDGARLLVLSHGIKGINNTYQRYKQLAMVEPRNAELYLKCAEAFITMSSFSTQEGLKYDHSGQYLNVTELSKRDSERLKTAFAPMRELEDVIKDKFRLTEFS